MGVPGTYNIEAKQGAKFTRALTLREKVSQDPIDLTGYSFYGRIRKNANASTALADFDFDITDAPNGKVTMSLAASVTATLAAPSTSNKKFSDTVYLYDVFYGPTGDASEVYALLEGTFSVIPQVTKQVIP